MTVFMANIFHSPKYGEIAFGKNQLIHVNDRGIIVEVLDREKNPTSYKKLLEKSKKSKFLKIFDENKCLIPGFVDLHIHAPQFPQMGIALDEPLNVWLQERTFPLEAKFSDLKFAKKTYTNLVKTLLANGTTTALYFASVDRKSSLLLAKICAKLGQRGLVGKVVMDNDSNPDFYRDSSYKEAIAETEIFINEVMELNKKTFQGVYPVITPRFIPSCTDESLKGLGELAKKYDVHIQSHISEGEWEHHNVLERYGKSDTQAMEGFGLLREKSVMAHGTYLSQSDGKIFAKTGSALAHCPISNAYFANSVMPLKRLKGQGVEIGLGTDISGGYSPSLYHNIRQAVISSRILEEGTDASIPIEQRGLKNSGISMNEAFYLATKGGANSLRLNTGSFEENMAADFQVIDISHLGTVEKNKEIFDHPEQILHKILYLANKEDIKKVYVQGRLVHRKR